MPQNATAGDARNERLREGASGIGDAIAAQIFEYDNDHGDRAWLVARKCIR
jgi:hypothetical protein